MQTSTSSRVSITVSNSPNPSRVYIRLCRHGKRFLLLNQKQSFINTGKYTLSHYRFCLSTAFSSVTLTYIALVVWLSNLMFLDGNGSSFLFNKIDHPRVRESKTVLDSRIHATDSGFEVLDSSVCQWNLDSGFQVRFRILELYSGFGSPGFRIPQAKISQIPETRFPVYIR